MLFIRIWKRNKQRDEPDVAFEEILLDSSNLPAFNRGRLEGRVELPLARRNVLIVGFLFVLIVVWFVSRLYTLQVVEGASFLDKSENNTLSKSVIIAERGVIYDTHGEMLAWNEPNQISSSSFPVRSYTRQIGLGQLLGYVNYPQKDKQGFYYRTDYVGRNGVEAAYNKTLSGTNGQQLIETDAQGRLASAHVVTPPIPGKSITLSIDAKLSQAMYDVIATATAEAHFRSGAGAIMDLTDGNIIAMTSFPSYDPQVMADATNSQLIAEYNNDKRFPFLNKIYAGVYTPGSIVKPFVSYAALKEGIITPTTHIFSNGVLRIPNPYTPSEPSLFHDWRFQGLMTVRQGLEYSSDVFFYIVGGGLPQIAVPQAGFDHPFTGLGIDTMDKYFNFFGFGHKTGFALAGERAGTVPSIAWKEDTFHQGWLLGDSYLTAIGQFGWQVTPLQMLVAYGALATGGRFFVPHIIKDEPPQYTDKPLDANDLAIVREGMRLTIVGARGTVQGLRRSDVEIAAKSGTAQLGVDNGYENSWVMGFWPYQHPHYVFALVMEHVPKTNTLGAGTIMNRIFDWIAQNEPELIGTSTVDTQIEPVHVISDVNSIPD